jgi:lysophospholipase L1-like esterase
MGARVDELFDEADEFAATDPDVMVLEMGTNDAAQPEVWSHEGIFWNLLAMHDRFRAAQCTVFVTVDEGFGDLGTFLRARRVNDVIAWLDANQANVRTVDWNGALRHLGRDQLLSDDVHPNATGSALLAQMIADTVSGGC